MVEEAGAMMQRLQQREGNKYRQKASARYSREQEDQKEGRMVEEAGAMMQRCNREKGINMDRRRARDTPGSRRTRRRVAWWRRRAP